MTRLDTAKVGDDVHLSRSLVADDGTLVPLESARVTIVRMHRTNRRVVLDQAAVIEDATVARYVWTAVPADGEFAIEWHLRHSGGLSRFADDDLIRIDRRWAGPT